MKILDYQTLRFSQITALYKNLDPSQVHLGIYGSFSYEKDGHPGRRMTWDEVVGERCGPENYGCPVQHRSVYSREVVFDFDGDEESVYRDASRAYNYLESQGFHFDSWATGGKGYHFHLFLSLTEAQVRELKALPREVSTRDVRLAFYEYVRDRLSLKTVDANLVDFSDTVSPHNVRAEFGRRDVNVGLKKLTTFKYPAIPQREYYRPEYSPLLDVSEFSPPTEVIPNVLPDDIFSVMLEKIMTYEDSMMAELDASGDDLTGAHMLKVPCVTALLSGEGVVRHDPRAGAWHAAKVIAIAVYRAGKMHDIRQYGELFVRGLKARGIGRDVSPEMVVSWGNTARREHYEFNCGEVRNAFYIYFGDDRLDLMKKWCFKCPIYEKRKKEYLENRERFLGGDGEGKS